MLTFTTSSLDRLGLEGRAVGQGQTGLFPAEGVDCGLCKDAQYLADCEISLPTIPCQCEPGTPATRDGYHGVTFDSPSKSNM